MDIVEIADMCLPDCLNGYGYCPIYDNGLPCPDTCNDMHFIAFCMIIDGLY